MTRSLILCALLAALLFACSTPTEEKEEIFEQETLKQESEEVREVIYSMYLPTDLADVFKRSGTNYDPGIPAPIDNNTLYTKPEQLAVMLGIYGVDITYMKLLGQTQDAAQYYTVIEQLAGRLGIPKSIFESSSEKLEKYFSNEDSLAMIIEDVFRNTDMFFKLNGHDNLAALSLAGGWVEAMYIGVSIFQADSGNYEMAERLLQQKYSLNSIHTLLSNHQESLTVKGYLLMLKRLKKVFDKVDIRYQKEGFSVDTAQKKLQAYNAHIRYDEGTLEELGTLLPQIRERLIEVSAAE